MPIQQCQRNNEEGWQWGEEGKCYLPSEEGSDDAAKEKAIEQALAAGASPDEFQQDETISTFASLKDVEIFRPGTHNDIDFSPDEIDEMIASSNACLPFILQSIEQGSYAENEALNAEIKASGKPIPALINLGHQRYLKDVKNFLKDVQIDFGKAGEWVTANISNVKDDIALMLQEVFNSRSVELIKELYNPLDGQTYRNVIRSIGFLPSHILPAVSGQNPELAVEFSERQGTIYLVTLYSHKNEPLEEEYIMPKPKVQEGVELEQAPAAALKDQSDGAIQEDDSGQGQSEGSVLINDFEKKVVDLQEEISLERKEKEALKRRLEIVEMQAAESARKEDEQAIALFCKDIRAEQLSDKQGNTFIASEVFVDSVRPLIQHSDNSAVIEFGENKLTTRQAVQEFSRAVLNMASQGNLLVPTNVSAFQHSHTPPEQMQKPKELNSTTIMEFYGADAKKTSAPDANERVILSKAFDLAALDEYRKIYGG